MILRLIICDSVLRSSLLCYFIYICSGLCILQCRECDLSILIIRDRLIYFLRIVTCSLQIEAELLIFQPPSFQALRSFQLYRNTRCIFYNNFGSIKVISFSSDKFNGLSKKESVRCRDFCKTICIPFCYFPVINLDRTMDYAFAIFVSR